MKIEIEKPLGLNQMGQRKNNEDSIFPRTGQATGNDHLFVVCDGVGGSARGEVASNIVCAEIPNYFTDNNIGVSDEATVKKAVERAENAIDKYLVENPEAHGMGTTLTMLHLHPDGATIAWCGDSRVYQIRGDEIYFKTADHSFVNEMLKAGLITPEEAMVHPKKNVITRAIQGQSVKKAKIDVHTTDEIQKGDIFFLCTDGVLESVTDAALISILSKQSNLDEKLNQINSMCSENSKDNYSCYLIQVSNVTGKSNNAPKQADMIPTADLLEDRNDRLQSVGLKPSPKRQEDSINKKKYNKRTIIYLSIILFSIVASLSLLFIGGERPKNKKEPEEQNLVKDKQKDSSASATIVQSGNRKFADGQNTSGKRDSKGNQGKKAILDSPKKASKTNQTYKAADKKKVQKKTNNIARGKAANRYNAKTNSNPKQEIHKDNLNGKEIEPKNNTKTDNTELGKINLSPSLGSLQNKSNEDSASTAKENKETFPLITVDNTKWTATNLSFDVQGCIKLIDQVFYNLEQAKKACPEGWQLPSESQFLALEEKFGGEFLQKFNLSFNGYYDNDKNKNVNLDKTAEYWTSEELKNQPKVIVIKNNNTKWFGNKRSNSKIETKKGDNKSFRNVRCVKIISN